MLNLHVQYPTGLANFACREELMDLDVRQVARNKNLTRRHNFINVLLGEIWLHTVIHCCVRSGCFSQTFYFIQIQLPNWFSTQIRNVECTLAIWLEISFICLIFKFKLYSNPASKLQWHRKITRPLCYVSINFFIVSKYAWHKDAHIQHSIVR